MLLRSPVNRAPVTRSTISWQSPDVSASASESRSCSFWIVGVDDWTWWYKGIAFLAVKQPSMGNLCVEAPLWAGQDFPRTTLLPEALSTLSYLPSLYVRGEGFLHPLLFQQICTSNSILASAPRWAQPSFYSFKSVFFCLTLCSDQSIFLHGCEYSKIYTLLTS